MKSVYLYEMNLNGPDTVIRYEIQLSKTCMPEIRNAKKNRSYTRDVKDSRKPQNNSHYLRGTQKKEQHIQKTKKHLKKMRQNSEYHSATTETKDPK